MNRIPCVAVLALACAACGEQVSARDAESQAPTAVPAAQLAPVPALPAAVEIMPQPVDAAPSWPAVLFSDLDAELAARIDGVVRQVRAELGDRVESGTVLVVLDDAGEAARVEAARAAVELARSEFARADGLLQNGFVTRAQLDEATFRVRSAEAALRVAEVDLEHTRIVAPFAGVITRRLTGPGRSVREGEPLFRLTTLEPLRATVRVPERDAHALRTGAAVTLIAGDGSRIAGRVQRISPATDPQSGTVEVLLDVPRPGPLRPGSSAAAVFHEDRAPGS